ncbi:MAG: substrate-binding domain-containing protein [Amaricoccus sp.]|uniref:substrate-binding domain-containing protein n=1 Tax=Amaricoccus sp. TaxID=1872485 RepID=UPI0039E258A2
MPADLSLVGVDDFEWADCFEPRLTLVAQPCAELGRQAASLLMERIREPHGPRRHVQLAAEVKLRDSVGRPR